MGSVTMPVIVVASKHAENVINSRIMYNKSSNVYGMIDQISMIIRFKKKWENKIEEIYLLEFGVGRSGVNGKIERNRNLHVNNYDKHRI